MADCSALQQQLDDLNNQLEDLKGQQEGATPEQKAGIGRAILVVRQKIPAVQAALAKCEAKHGTLFPAYHLTSLIYAPPGQGSEVEYASGSTMGTTTEVTNTFKAGVSISTGGGFFGNGVDVSLAFSGGPKDGISFEVKKERTSIYTLESQIDPVDHSRDTYLIWTNVQVDATLPAGSSDLELELSVRGGGNAMNIVSLTGAELKDPTLISDQKKASLVGFTQKDFDSILAMNPFTRSKVPDPNRLRFITTLQLDGPDHPQDPIPGQGILIGDEQAKGVIHGSTSQLTVGLTLNSGIDLIVKASLALGLTFEWDYENTTNVSTGTKEEATVKLKTVTVGYHDVIDVYQDTVFNTFAFVSHREAIPGLTERVFGFVLTESGEAAFNQRVEAVAKGSTRTAFTNAQGIYRLYDVPDGELRVTVDGDTKIVTLLPGKKVELPFGPSRGMPITPQISNTIANLNGVAFPDTSHGWAEGAIAKEDGSRVGIVIATADGGTHWTQVLETTMQLRDIAFPDLLHGCVVGGDPPTILATVDGGGTWKPQTSGIEDDHGALFAATAFPDAQHGWIVGAVSNGGVILATADGGATWRHQAQDAPNFADDFRGVAFPDTQHGWVVGAASPEGGSLILATSDAGETWERQTIPATNHLGNTYLLFGIAFADLNHGLAVGDNGTILATADGGITWTATPSGTDALLLRVAFPDVDNGWAVGQANDGTGVILVTSDGGDTWTLDIPEATSEPLWGVAFPDSRHGWLVGVSGTILRSF